MKNLISLVILLGGSLLPAAPAGAQPGGSLIHLDKPFYVSGETIWYALFLPGADGCESAVVQVRVLRPNGELLATYVHRASQCVASGFLPVAVDWPSGVYRLGFSAMTVPASAMPVDLGQVAIPVFNDSEADTGQQRPGSGRAAPRPAPAGDGALQVEISPAKDRYSPRGDVRATVSIRGADGRPRPARLSVAVVDDELCGEAAFPWPTVVRADVAIPSGASLDSLLQVGGRVRDSLGRPLATPFLAANVQPADRLLFTQTDTSGRFLFRFRPQPVDGVVQVLDYRESGLMADPISLPDLSPAPPLPHADGVERYRERSRERKKIYQLFDSLEMAVSIPLIRPVPSPDTPDQHLATADYPPMTDLPAFLRDVTTPLKFRREGDRLVARMFNPQYGARTFYPDAPLFQVDGLFTRDASFAAGLEMAGIDHIDLFFYSATLRRRFGALGRFGVARIAAADHGLPIPPGVEPTLISIPGLQPPASFPLASAAAEADGTPAFRPQVYWAPSLPAGADGRASLTFPHTDDKGRFRIRVLAVDETGAFGVGEAYYEVR